MEVWATGETNIGGTRNSENQDAYLIKDRMFVVADGHGRGGKVAAMAACEAFDTVTSDMSMEDAFSLAEDAVAIALTREARPSIGGTTASVLFIDRNGQCQVGHVGDSAVRYYDEDGPPEGVSLMEDHSPSSMEEFRRIYATHPDTRFVYTFPPSRRTKEQPVFIDQDGEWVYNPVQGWKCTVRDEYATYVVGPKRECLAMTRALGDFNMKNGGVIATPSIVCAPPPPTGVVRRIVLASDGLWDVLRYEEVGDIVRRSKTEENAAKILVDAAICASDARFGPAGNDNITAIVVYMVSQ